MIATPVSYALKEQCRARASETGAKRDDLHSELNWLGCPSGVGPQERWFTESVLQLQLDSKQVHWYWPQPLPNKKDLFTTLDQDNYLARFVYRMPFSRFSWIYILKGTWPHPQGVVPLQMAALWSLQCTTYSQRIMDQLLQDVQFTVCHLDNFPISGGSPEEHLAILKEVFGYLKKHGVTLNPAKCTLFQPWLDFLGNWIGKSGIFPLLRKWCEHWCQES